MYLVSHVPHIDLCSGYSSHVPLDPHYPHDQLPLCPIGHVPHYPFLLVTCPITHSPITYVAITYVPHLDVCSVYMSHVPLEPQDLLAMCPITQLPHLDLFSGYMSYALLSPPLHDHYLFTPLPMCSITHVLHPDVCSGYVTCAPWLHNPWPISHVPHWPCAPWLYVPPPVCPITHLSHLHTCSGYMSHVSLDLHDPLPMCPLPVCPISHIHIWWINMWTSWCQFNFFCEHPPPRESRCFDYLTSFWQFEIF